MLADIWRCVILKAEHGNRKEQTRQVSAWHVRSLVVLGLSVVVIASSLTQYALRQVL